MSNLSIFRSSSNFGQRMANGPETYFRMQVNLNEEEIDQLMSAATRRSLRRNELLLQYGQVCRHKTFVVKGLLRTFGTAADGSEYILQFSPENNWTLDAESYHQLTPSQFNIGAVEQSEVMQWNKTDFDRLLTDIPALNNFSQQLVSQNNYRGRHRLFATLSGTPEEKYEDFVRNHSDLLARLPLHMIAGYLGISLKTLTRLRHSQLHR